MSGATVDTSRAAPPTGFAAANDPLLRERTTVPTWRRLMRNRRIAIGVGVLLVMYLFGLLAPWLAPADPNAQILLDRLKPPSGAHPLGTDSLGRDMLSRAIWATRITLSVSLVAMLITIVVGATLGLVAGFLGGAVDMVLMRLTDMLMAFPIFILLITIVAIYGSSLALLILFLGLTAWPLTARTIRAEVLSLKHRDFIDAARINGASTARILWFHVLPGVISVIVVAATLRVATVILIESGLSYFGLGVTPPTPTWGNMASEGRLFLETAWWITTFPGILIVVTVLAYNLLGDGLRDELDPRRRGR
ncbi:MAG: ABC transporter permease [Chloroflexota bacterium]|nr:ABC transporter permease [Chloroflexota bacterium]